MISKLEELVTISRAYNYHILVGVQRADSIYFGSARFNFKCRIAMGNLDAEGKRMLFGGYTELMNEQNEIGEGYLLVDGKGLERIKVVIKVLKNLMKWQESQCTDSGGADGEAEQKTSEPPAAKGGVLT